MRVSAKADYAVRAMIELAGSGGEGAPRKGEEIAKAQYDPVPFLENILAELRHNGLVQSRRGAEGGYWLSRLPEEVTIADIIRAVEGPLASVRGEPPDEISYAGAAEPLQTRLDRPALEHPRRARAGHPGGRRRRRPAARRDLPARARSDSSRI